MIEQSILNLLKKCVVPQKEAFLLIRAYFDIHAREKLLSFLKNHSDFRMESKRGINCLAVWLDSERKEILGLVKIYKKRCVLECLTREQIEKGKKILEKHLKGAITFRAYSYQNINLTSSEKIWDSSFYLKNHSSAFRESPQIQNYKLKLEEEILAILDAGVRLLRAIEKTETFNPFMTKTLCHLTQLIDKLSNFPIFLEITDSFTTLKEIRKQIYFFFDQIEAKFGELLEEAIKKEEVIQLYLDEDWDHFEEIEEEALNPLPDNLSEALMAGWRRETERIMLSPEMDLTTVLKKQPIEWLEAIHSFLGLNGGCKDKTQYVETISHFLKSESNLKQIVDSIGLSAQRVLRFILKANGICAYEYLINAFGNDNQDGYYWRERPPKSAIGVSRARGLLFVGHIKKLNAIKKVAFIPCDLRHPLQRIISIPGNNPRLFE